MQCKHCGDNDFESGYEEEFQEQMRMRFVATWFRCRTCGTVHFLKFNWADFDFVPLPEEELVNP